jgi:hypothetical protein
MDSDTGNTPMTNPERCLVAKSQDSQDLSQTDLKKFCLECKSDFYPIYKSQDFNNFFDEQVNHKIKKFLYDDQNLENECEFSGIDDKSTSKQCKEGYLNSPRRAIHSCQPDSTVSDQFSNFKFKVENDPKDNSNNLYICKGLPIQMNILQNNESSIFNPRVEIDNLKIIFIRDKFRSDLTTTDPTYLKIKENWFDNTLQFSSYNLIQALCPLDQPDPNCLIKNEYEQFSIDFRETMMLQCYKCVNNYYLTYGVYDAEFYKSLDREALPVTF